MRERKDFTTGDLKTHIIVSATPIVLAMIFQTSLTLVDLFFVARLGEVEVAAVSMTFPVMFFIIALASGISIGTNSYISRLFGSKQYEKAGKVAGNSIILMSIIGICLSIIGYIFALQIFSFMGATGDLLIAVNEYARIHFLGMITMFLIWVLNGIFRGTGEMGQSMKIMIVATIFNIILDPILIFTFHMGLKGAAIAGIIARTIGVCVGIYYLMKDKDIIHVKFPKKGLDYQITREILRIGIPSSITTTSASIGFFIITKLIAGYGMHAVAGFGIASRIDALVFLPVIGIGAAVTSIVGQNIGKGHITRAKETVKHANRIGLIVVGVLAVIVFIFAEKAVMIFGSSPEAITVGSEYLRFAVVGDVFFCLIINYASAFEGAGLPIPAFTLGAMRSLVLLLPFIYLFSIFLHYGIIGLWIAGVLAMLITAIIGFIWFNKIKWERNLKPLEIK